MEYKHIICDLDNPYQSEDAVNKVIDLCLQHPFKGVHVPNYWAKKVIRDLKEKDITVISSIGEASGNDLTQIKLFALKELLKLGVEEVSVTINLSALRTNSTWCKIEFLQLTQTAHEKETLITLRLPKTEINQDEIQKIIQVVNHAGVDSILISEQNLHHLEMVQKEISDLVEIQVECNNQQLLQKLLQQNIKVFWQSYVNLS
ncbi:beta/alpha barrel domain-containing protein [Flammeovirga agarivorans]|uniref:Deoxyribose-phosphate aldolase n=1 Tax=Flammeovirga agarivorans TaxID=2726742 RepID=A0A7X8SIL3_9BACT|nr:hypothetical protein [Flammeovirga agarivorans]NLR90943.1 hypothetical protein [Flammeovirga agarivorans]